MNEFDINSYKQDIENVIISTVTYCLKEWNRMPTSDEVSAILMQFYRQNTHLLSLPLQMQKDLVIILKNNIINGLNIHKNYF